MLARIVGLFHVGFKNTASGDARRLDILVIENLLHNRPGVTQIYDLKGSLRKRLIPEAGESSVGPPVNPQDSINEGLRWSWGLHGIHAGANATGGIPSNAASVPVLLDQNFINNSLENPVYLRFHSKVPVFEISSIISEPSCSIVWLIFTLKFSPILPIFLFCRTL